MWDWTLHTAPLIIPQISTYTVLTKSSSFLTFNELSAWYAQGEKASSFKYLLCVHVILCCHLWRVQIHHGGLDCDSGLDVGRSWGDFILLFVPAQALPAFSVRVGTTWVEAVLTGSWFPHVLCKLTARWHFTQHTSCLGRTCCRVTGGWSQWSREKADWSWCIHECDHLRGNKKFIYFFF